ncbi:HemK2/MTQ2 family protein methyltransferase [Mycobacterium sp. URHB0021]
MTTASSDFGAIEGVYAPQQDTQLLIDALDKTELAPGRRIADLCTGSGLVALSAAEMGAASVTAFDMCPKAVQCARANARAAGLSVDVHVGSWCRAIEFGPFDVVVCNPPYVPHDPGVGAESFPAHVPELAVNAGRDGRLVLDPLCATAPGLLKDGGTLLLAQSEFADVDQSLHALCAVGLDADVLIQQWIPFGPVMSARADWLERTGRLRPGRRDERIVVIRADKR